MLSNDGGSLVGAFGLITPLLALALVLT